MRKVLIKMGDIFEAHQADLIVLPCSATGSIRKSIRKSSETYGFSTPEELNLNLQHGDISALYPFPDTSIAKFFVYAASVLYDYSSKEILESIGEKLGILTTIRNDIRHIETVLLGTGAGGVPTEVAGYALSKGFHATSKDSILVICVQDAERLERLKKVINGNMFSRLWNSLTLKPSLYGFGIDLKKFFGRKR